MPAQRPFISSQSGLPLRRGWLPHGARLRWPLPALAAWSAAWAVWAMAGALTAPAALAWTLAVAVGALMAWPCQGRWRQAIVAAGFPLSAWILGAAAGLPSWAWLLMLLPLLAAYPLRAWKDAPLFPTPRRALTGLQDIVPAPARVLDAGCGLGDGLMALREVWPQAALEGVEWSAPLAWLARWRCHVTGIRARVWRADMWQASWSGVDVVYVFQRPESMPRVYAKAARELSTGAWLVSLEFEVAGYRPVAGLHRAGSKPVWIYQPAGPAAPSVAQGVARAVRAAGATRSHSTPQASGR